MKRILNEIATLMEGNEDPDGYVTLTDIDVQYEPLGIVPVYHVNTSKECIVGKTGTPILRAELPDDIQLSLTAIAMHSKYISNKIRKEVE